MLDTLDKVDGPRKIKARSMSTVPAGTAPMLDIANKSDHVAVPSTKCLSNVIPVDAVNAARSSCSAGNS